jgi:hypothetical protein
VSKENIQTEWSKFGILVDTTKTFRVDIDKSKLKIIETITTKKYDKDTGTITEETTTEREVTQDSDKVVSETEETEVTEGNDVLVKNKSDFSKTIDSEEKIESIGGKEAFGKWFGIVFGVIVGILLVYLLRKF